MNSNDSKGINLNRIMTTVHRLGLLLGVCCGMTYSNHGRGFVVSADDHSALPDARQAVETLIERNSNQAEWQLKLATFPSSDVVPILVGYLQTDPRFRDNRLRTIAYRMLVVHGAESTELGLAELLCGFRVDFPVADALGRLGANAPPEIIEGIGKRLIRDMPRPSTMLIKALGSFEAASLPYLGRLAEVYRNTALKGDREPTERASAAQALIAIGGTEFALNHFEAVRDSDGRKAALWALGSWGSKTFGTYDTTAEHRARARGFVLEGLKDKDPDVRQAAAEALGPAFGNDIMVIRSRHDYNIVPQARQALEHLVDHETDDRRRELAKKLLNPAEHDTWVERIVRRATLPSNVEQRVKAALRGLASDRANARLGWMEVLRESFGDDLLIVRSAADFQLRAELKEPLQRIAESDPEPELRALASEFLNVDYQRRLAARIIERRYALTGVPEEAPVDSKGDKSPQP